jgi:hypothetical protein
LSVVIWTTALLCSALLILFSVYMYPVPDGDSIGFVPAVKSYAETGLLQNPLYLRPHTIDPQGLGRFLSYTPGMTIYVGGLMRLFGQVSYESAFLVLALFRCASIFLFARIVILSLERRAGVIGFWRIIVSVLLVISNALFLFHSNGRPEILTLFLVSVALLVALSVRPKIKRHILIQVCIGLLFPVSLANALIGLAMYCVYLVFDYRSTRSRLACLCTAILVSFIIFVSSYAVVSVPLGDALDGLSKGRVPLRGVNP